MSEWIAWILTRLELAYGPRTWVPPDPGRTPTDELIGTILSQNTTDTNSGRAFAALKQRFPDTRELLHLPRLELEATIRVCGLARTKAQYISTTLARFWQDQQDIEGHFLCAWPPEKAWAYLISLPGIGPKTAACVLMFHCGAPVLPVDTHVHRVATRLGLIAPSRQRGVAVHQALQAQLQPEQVYPFHVLLIQHGRQTCKAQKPRCQACVLREGCVYGQTLTSA
ncbi:endonuclease III [Leptolyngbya sp. FACHB-261]|uniref:endonuclease III domain-containing protein n=1 Tax=Leptolyngbya sp. FACHB-261 TaxID=2692806 RepID=UPI0016853345|nr:endonuclease III [Leptolyngbya sp. FACHB-261]MBD2104375.1 endonuclease III [Leptolyngbya sp. FACHB-261]